MPSKKLAMILAIIGLGTVAIGVLIFLQNNGSCPADQLCDHYIQGTEIYAGATGRAIFIPGLIILGLSLVTWGANSRKSTNQSKTSKIG